jgi:hypothetical protein
MLLRLCSSMDTSGGWGDPGVLYASWALIVVCFQQLIQLPVLC